MTTVDRWQLPDGVEEVLPRQARVVEHLRRELLDLYHQWGYQLVIPPLIEFTESLLIGLGRDLDLLTFKMTDQLSGRTLGIRADITPQVARIDAHSLAEPGVTRLCYAGSTLHTRPKSLLASRSPIQLGAELYGDDSLAGDVEIIRLMLATLNAAGVAEVTLDLGHVGVYEAVLAAANVTPEQEADVFDALQRKSRPDLLLALTDIAAPAAELILGLLELHGDAAVLETARRLLAKAAPEALTAVAALETVATAIARSHPGTTVYFDLAELRGYHYHTGMVFAAYAPGHGQALANGGRYNDVGKVFGRARPATGFATDLKALMALVPISLSAPGAVSAPDSDDPALLAAVTALRKGGEVVIRCVGRSPDPRCDRMLVKADDEWVLRPLKS
ncbi:ATP phosphoribosyltransferase regulatory subunit [Haliea sp.]|jgi:ATP phosphoribosyltransferase regulatory subunit|uniref:ATP phosphoribosyltransferase regulatory subunit n=1 Tax=Haliea TaxID=475794 RepID=UPI000C51FD0C|nr:ATP phosphoribosyltransferase regulatory subunit [Haliea sp.]MAY94121.1 ATP phosphoribosyltransferase regulatory subunit [Haliea sp.]MBK40134.1 ATP phosphoribosyltransferase regulatory subunit [Haliea sp.]MBP71279.1 ATP phosphoribosyltransferase regulatory subunit [Haliea sp.]HCD55333.1 ATP phosphoribosyltransferase regulatory subunit [Halieaceae bacterium]|tara:strand:- start:6170 stop:7339 length:1170 start_codon:yes stop_codon:yes gene_type:complete